MSGATDIPAAQVPLPGELNLDHVAHFVPDKDEASAALEGLGFTLTPFSPQSHRLHTDGPLVPAGTGNRCIMLERGYIEFLTPMAETPIADQLRAAISRYTGVHLIAFGTAAPDADHQRLSSGGFEPLPPVALQRPIGTDHGEHLARFTVVRVPPGKMAEGRIQFCQQHTPQLVWQDRWTAHPNAASGLTGVLVCVDDPEGTARRYSRFAGIDAEHGAGGWTLRTTRGSIVFAGPAAVERVLGVKPPALPWIAGYALESRDVAATKTLLRSASPAPRELPGGHLLVPLPPALGGLILFGSPGSALPAFH